MHALPRLPTRALPLSRVAVNQTLNRHRKRPRYVCCAYLLVVVRVHDLLVEYDHRLAAVDGQQAPASAPVQLRQLRLALQHGRRLQLPALLALPLLVLLPARHVLPHRHLALVGSSRQRACTKLAAVGYLFAAFNPFTLKLE